MKGFRDLDPGGAEQVYATRKRRKEYLEDLEEELYARLLPSDYDAKPSESADTARRETGRIPADDVALGATRRIRRDTGRYAGADTAAGVPRRDDQDTGRPAGMDSPAGAVRRDRQDTGRCAGADAAAGAARRGRRRSVRFYEIPLDAEEEDDFGAGRYERAIEEAVPEAYEGSDGWEQAPYPGEQSVSRASSGQDVFYPQDNVTYRAPYPGEQSVSRAGSGQDAFYPRENATYRAPYPGEQSVSRTDSGRDGFYPRENAVYYDAYPDSREEGSRYAGYEEEDPEEATYEEPAAVRGRNAARYASGIRPDADRYKPALTEEDDYYEDGESGEGDGDWDLYEEDERRPRRGGRSRRAMILTLALLVSVITLALIGLVFLIGSRHSRKQQDLARVDSSGVQGANDAELSLPEEELPDDEPEEDPEEEEPPKSAYLEPSEEKDIFFEGYEAHTTDKTALIGEEQGVVSSYAVLINAETGEIVAQKDADAITSPASMTKILTLLVAVEHLTDLDETVVMTQEIGSAVYNSDLSAVGYKVDDVIPVRDLLYGTILPSGADAAMLLAEHVAGSQEAFVELMNDKVKELGLSDTAHFTNCVGFYDEENHCTMKDMAMILKAAVENKLCREVLSAHIYTTDPTPEHPTGIEISNWFLRRIEDKDTHGEVICAKTGFVDQSGCCAASYQISNDGGRWICVTGNTYSSWRCIYDHVSLYDLYTN